MSSADKNFDELIRKIERGRDFTSASYESVYYLVFDPSEILPVKRLERAWASRLQQKNFDPYFFSIADAIDDVHSNFQLRNIWLKADKGSPLDWEKTNNSLKVALQPKERGGPGPIQTKIEDKLSSLENKKNAVLIVTDLEALHPYLRIGAIENQLYGKFKVPTVFLYPGTRSGDTRLSFLGFYPDDGNYRSVHVGG